MPAVEISLSGEDINKAIAEAVLTSHLGNILKTNIQKILTDSYSTDNAIRTMILDEMRKHIQKTIPEMLDKDLRERVKKVLVEFVTEKGIEEIAKKMIKGY